MSRVNRDAEYFTDHTLNPESARVCEHETMLSFNNDSGNYAFNEWWLTEGLSLYRDWVSGRLDQLNEDFD